MREWRIKFARPPGAARSHPLCDQAVDSTGWQEEEPASALDPKSIPRELTDIGNEFQSRHSETDREPITDADMVDYLLPIPSPSFGWSLRRPVTFVSFIFWGHYNRGARRNLFDALWHLRNTILWISQDPDYKGNPMTWLKDEPNFGDRDLKE
jgi:hypothetical protein